MSTKLTPRQVEKIGNTLIYLSKKVSELNKTKILKLLFFLEEASIKKYGYPFFGVDFKIWVRGPVLENVFFDFDQASPVLFKDYVKRDQHDRGLYIATNEFNDDEFSENDIKLLDEICRFAKHKNANDLVEISHKSDSLWEKSAKKYSVFDDLIKERLFTTPYLIDFSFLFENDEFRRQLYENAKENIEAINSLNN